LLTLSTANRQSLHALRNKGLRINVFFAEIHLWVLKHKIFNITFLFSATKRPVWRQYVSMVTKITFCREGNLPRGSFSQYGWVLLPIWHWKHCKRKSIASQLYFLWERSLRGVYIRIETNCYHTFRVRLTSIIWSCWFGSRWGCDKQNSEYTLTNDRPCQMISIFTHAQFV